MFVKHTEIYQSSAVADMLPEHGTTVRITHPQHLTPSMRGILSSYWNPIWYGKTRMAGLYNFTQSFGHNTST